MNQVKHRDPSWFDPSGGPVISRMIPSRILSRIIDTWIMTIDRSNPWTNTCFSQDSINTRSIIRLTIRISLVHDPLRILRRTNNQSVMLPTMPIGIHPKQRIMDQLHQQRCTWRCVRKLTRLRPHVILAADHHCSVGSVDMTFISL